MHQDWPEFKNHAATKFSSKSYKSNSVAIKHLANLLLATNLHQVQFSKNRSPFTLVPKARAESQGLTMICTHFIHTSVAFNPISQEELTALIMSIGLLNFSCVLLLSAIFPWLTTFLCEVFYLSQRKNG